MGFLARGSDGEESFDTVDTDYLSSRGCNNAWVNGRRWSVNGASDGAGGVRGHRSGSGFPVVRMTIVNA